MDSIGKGSSTISLGSSTILQLSNIYRTPTAHPKIPQNTLLYPITNIFRGLLDSRLGIRMSRKAGKQKIRKITKNVS